MINLWVSNKFYITILNRSKKLNLLQNVIKKKLGIFSSTPNYLHSQLNLGLGQ